MAKQTHEEWLAEMAKRSPEEQAKIHATRDANTKKFCDDFRKAFQEGLAVEAEEAKTTKGKPLFKPEESLVEGFSSDDKHLDVD